MNLKIRRLSIIFLLGLSLFGACDKAFAIEDVSKVHAPYEDDEGDLFRVVKIKDGDILTIQDCVAVAFNNSPLIKRQKYNLDVAKSNLGIAKSEYFPTLGAGVGFTHQNNSNKEYYFSDYRDLPNVSVALQQLIWNFGKTTANIRMEEFYKIAAEYEFMDSLCRTLFDVKIKYYNLLLAQSKLQFAVHNLKIAETILEEAKNLHTKDFNHKADVENAILRTKEAKIAYIRAENDLKNAKIDLDNSMYLDRQIDYDIVLTKTYNYVDEYITEEPVEPFSYRQLPFDKKDAVEIAYRNSPDLRGLEAMEKAMEQNLIYIKKTYLPDLFADVGYGYNNNNVMSGNNSLSVGVTMSTSVNAMHLRNNIKKAEAQVNLAQNEIELFKKDLFFRVKQALNTLDKAERQIAVAQVEAETSVKVLDIVLRDYKAGKTDYTAMQDARVDYHEALLEYAISMYEYNIALIEVEQAMHCHIADIHHKSEHAVQYHTDELIEHMSRWMNCDEKELKKHKKKSEL